MSQTQVPMSVDLNVDFAARLHQIVQAIVTVLAVINSVVCGFSADTTWVLLQHNGLI